jgi:hypothetical protein
LIIFPRLRELPQQFFERYAVLTGVGIQHAVPSAKYRGVSSESLPRHPRGHNRNACRIPGMEWFRHRSKVTHQPTHLRRCETPCRLQLSAAQAAQAGGYRGRREHAYRRGGMPAAQVMTLSDGTSELARNLEAQRVGG